MLNLKDRVDFLKSRLGKCRGNHRPGVPNLLIFSITRPTYLLSREVLHDTEVPLLAVHEAMSW